MVQQPYNFHLYPSIWWPPFVTGIVMSVCTASLAGLSERSTVAMDQLNSSLKCLSPADIFENDSMIPRVFSRLACSWILWASIPNQPVEVATIPDSSNLCHFPIQRCSRLLLRLFVCWRIIHLLSSPYVASGGTDLPASNRTTEVEDSHSVFCLHGLESCVEIAAGCRVSLNCSECSLGFRVFCFIRQPGRKLRSKLSSTIIV